MAAPNWDANSRRLSKNLVKVLERAVADADRRVVPNIHMARQWHSMAMEGLDADGQPNLVGNFRGDPGVEDVMVSIDGVDGALPGHVATELTQFEATSMVSRQRS